MMKLDAVIATGKLDAAEFNTESFKSLLMALVVNKHELDIDLLLMIKDEVLSLHDCTYHSLLIIKDMIVEIKELYQASIGKSAILKTSTAVADPILANFEVIRKNLIDVMRVLSIPEEIDSENMLIEISAAKKAKSNGEDDEDSDGEGGGGGDSSDEEQDEKRKKEAQKDALLSKMDPLLAELAGLKPSGNRGTKRGAGGAGSSNKRSKPEASLYEKLHDVSYYSKAFSKAWLALLSLPFTTAQHKLLLRHLPEHVIPHMRSPMLLADYLTQSYTTGGVVAVLALESLFQLIVKFNLDYPDFFLSLYNLCTVEVFCAKYRYKFMKLLNASLRSVNLPAYLVAAFIKRLMHISLHSLTPNAPFCIAQCTWLLRQHPQSQVLIHRKSSSAAKAAGGALDAFDNEEKKDLENAQALQSSAWELECQQNNFIHSIAALATSVTTPQSTMVGAGAGDAYVVVEDHMALNYIDIMAKEAGVETFGSKKQMGKKDVAALAYVPPKTLFTAESLIGANFVIG
jgi:hypothetical protein